MPTITVPEETYQRLSRRAAALGTTVEAVALPALDEAANDAKAEFIPTPPPAQLAYEQWKKISEEIIERAQSRAHLYPPGFEADVSRESIYEGCGE